MAHRLHYYKGMKHTNNHKGDTMRKFTINPKYTKTYKTVENLEKAIAKLQERFGLPDSLMYVQCEVEGRHTAVFTNAMNTENGMYLTALTHNGFVVVG